MPQLNLKDFLESVFSRLFQRKETKVEKSEFVLEIPIKAPFYVEVIGELPCYVPIPDTVILKPSLIGAEPFFLEFSHFTPPRHPEDSQGENIDDRMGTYIRSKSRVLFPLSQFPNGDIRDLYEEKALSITNRAIEAARYVAFDHTIRRIEQFDRVIVRSWKIHENGEVEPQGSWTEMSSFGPFGVRILGTLSGDALQSLWYAFNGITPIHAAWLLILDAKYHTAFGDISRAILDLCTALEIHIPSLIELYSFNIPSLREIDVDGAGIFRMYHSILENVTGHSLHEKPELFVKLEYIRAVRNSIAHSWKPEFKITQQMRKNSRYIDVHQPNDGHVITSKEEVDGLVEDAIEIIRHIDDLFKDMFFSN